MEFVDKTINEALNQELVANESDRIEDFRRKSTKRFFSTISAFVGYSWYMEQSPRNTETSWKRYCYSATNQLMSDLKRLGLEYQKITGIWAGEIENSFLVWNTNYTFEQFRDLMLKLNENYKQWGICIGRWDIDKNEYSIDLWETDSLDNIMYSPTKHFTKVSVRDSILESGTILTRHIYSKEGKIDLNKERNISFEALEHNICCAASEGMAGYYHRRDLLEEYLGSKVNGR